MRIIVGLSFISFIDLGEPYCVAAGSGVDKITGTRKNPTQTLAATTRYYPYDTIEWNRRFWCPPLQDKKIYYLSFTSLGTEADT